MSIFTSISGIIKPKQFVLFVGIMLFFMSLLFLARSHVALALTVGYLGAALAATGFVWDYIYP